MLYSSFKINYNILARMNKVSRGVAPRWRRIFVLPQGTVGWEKINPFSIFLISIAPGLYRHSGVLQLSLKEILRFENDLTYQFPQT